MRLILLGPPGVGKGTQAVRLAKELGTAHISTGDILRTAVREETELGKKAKAYMDRGALVPDDLMVELIQMRLKEPATQSHGFILDGFPRTEIQANALEKSGVRLDHVISLQADDAVVIQRIAGRRTCSKCGAGFHVRFHPPKKAEVCDHCGQKLFQRDDDREETVTRRLEVYRDQTAPLLVYYKNKGLLREVPGDASVDEVFQATLRAVGRA